MGRNGPELTAVRANSSPPLTVRSQEMPGTRDLLSDSSTGAAVQRRIRELSPPVWSGTLKRNIYLPFARVFPGEPRSHLASGTKACYVNPSLAFLVALAASTGTSGVCLFTLPISKMSTIMPYRFLHVLVSA
ncbi:hypothetical protein RRG08_048280 [Elysia crispata]|uniref:Uncharacterized protein n=1 Tax=Elysia crispata TaxID=231223 RepID=A0AAE0ZT33_9GAST|nr:hypothetical protein RRG08_048280 [Elysia crispata]